LVHYEVRKRCSVLTLDRPQARNSLTPEMTSEIESHLDAAEADEDVRVVILTGVQPVFCAGSDLKAVQEGRWQGNWTERGGYGGIVRRQRTKPLIAALDGPAYGGGTEICLACDLIVASRDAGFALSEIKLGLVPGGGGLFNLARRVPRNVAMRVGLTGDPLSVESAHRFGLVNELCEPGEALETALRVAAAIAANGPIAMRESKALLDEATLAGDDAAFARNELAVRNTVDTEDAREGVAAFLEKRPARFRGL
jgi:enoyl-CoA hydratase